MTESLEQDVEVVEEDVELSPTESGLVGASGDSDKRYAEDMFWLADNIDKLVEARNRVVSSMLKLAKPGDWISFSSDIDPDGTASLGYPGAMRIGSNAGFSYMDRKVKKIIGRDKIGEWYRYEAEVTCIFRGHQVRTWGRASTRDSFFGKTGDRWRDLSEINEGNVKMAAIHGAMKEGVKVLLGIPSFPVKELIQMGVTVDFTKGHHFKGRNSADGANKPPISPETEAIVRAKVRAMLMELNDANLKAASDMLESLSGFEGKDGPVAGKRHLDYLKGTWLTATYGKVKAAYREKFGKDFIQEAELPIPAA